MTEAHDSWLLAYERVSSLPTALSDALCMLATGGGFSTRLLHSNDEETLLQSPRPTILTGIEDFVRTGELMDHCIILQLSDIPDSTRLPERTFWSEFEADYPRLLGALLSAAAGGLRMMAELQLAAVPRLADFARWGEAVGLGLGADPGSFIEQFHSNRFAASWPELDGSALFSALRGLIDRAARPWEGSASELLRALAEHALEPPSRLPGWPRTPRALSCWLRRMAPQLRAIGITVSFERRGDRRTVTIRSCGRTIGWANPEALEQRLALDEHVTQQRAQMTQTTYERPAQLVEP
jgi:hypothetical protein